MATARQDLEAETSAMVACARDAGFAIETTRDGGIVFDSSDIGLAQTVEECATQLQDPEDQRPMSEMSVDEVGTLYDRALDTAACLEAHGYEISAPPSRDAWIESHISMKRDEWIPFNDAIKAMETSAHGPNAETYYKLFSACPQDGAIANAYFGE